VHVTDRFAEASVLADRTPTMPKFMAVAETAQLGSNVTLTVKFIARPV
jgi:hypothetical protein